MKQNKVSYSSLIHMILILGPNKAKRIKKIEKLGILGVELEKINLGIDRKYQDILDKMKSKMSSLKSHFSSLLDDVQKDFAEKILNEKRQNLSNIKELEDDLNKAISNPDSDLKERELAAFIDLFSFMKEFSEESHSLILSTPVDIQIGKLKKELEGFVGRNLNRLVDPPKAFLTELFRFFKETQDVDAFENDIMFGDSFNLEERYPDGLELEIQKQKFSPFKNKSTKAPLLKILDNKYLVTASRSHFEIYFYQQGPAPTNEGGLQKRKSRFSTLGNVSNAGPNNKLNLFQIFNSQDSQEFCDEVQEPGFHCICQLLQSEGSNYLLLGGNHNVS